ncbi:hypothetical protein EVAR_67301_1 [Eumeta japonica]|uniref:Uncharacterized protein n=1 Tax=Eumeta variegata TaxID=151549 RepID=A0A4C2ACD4_EUMVA|nr:hypothetical protein EVAR_67301_1 [Eumeta japonica]
MRSRWAAGKPPQLCPRYHGSSTRPPNQISLCLKRCLYKIKFCSIRRRQHFEITAAGIADIARDILTRAKIGVCQVKEKVIQEWQIRWNEEKNRLKLNNYFPYVSAQLGSP